MMSHARRSVAPSAPASGRLEGPRRQREVDDPLDLERPQGVARLVVADQVQRVGRQRRLEQVRAHLGPAGLALGPVVARRRVPEAHDPPLRPGPREVLHVAVEGLVHAPRGEVVEGALDVLAQGVRQALLELLERRGEVRLVLVGVARHEPRRQEHRHRLGERQPERRQERARLDAPAAALAPDREPAARSRARAGRGRPSASTSPCDGRSRPAGSPPRRSPGGRRAPPAAGRGGRACPRADRPRRRRPRRAPRRSPASQSVMRATSVGRHCVGGKTVTGSPRSTRSAGTGSIALQRVLLRGSPPGPVARPSAWPSCAVGEHPVVEVARASGRCPSRRSSRSTSGSARRSVSPSSVIRQCRARAPSM